MGPGKLGWAWGPPCLGGRHTVQGMGMLDQGGTPASLEESPLPGLPRSTTHDPSPDVGNSAEIPEKRHPWWPPGTGRAPGLQVNLAKWLSDLGASLSLPQRSALKGHPPDGKTGELQVHF